MKRKDQYNGANLDILYVLLLGISVLYLLALYLIEIIEPRPANVQKNANWIIEMSWPEDIDCDIDLWVKDPLGNTSYFNQKNVGLMHIERDDLGKSSDVVQKNGKTYLTTENREVWTLRGELDGRYVVSVHSYACSVKKTENAKYTDSRHTEMYRFMMNFLKPGSPINVPVSVKVIRINPSYNIYYEEVVVLDKVWQEKNAIKFNLDGMTAQKLDEPFERLVHLVR